MIYHTHCALRLGDNLAHLHLLRALAQHRRGSTFVHWAHPHYLPQLIEVVSDLENIHMHDIRYLPKTVFSHDAWKNAGGYWENHPQRNDYAPFYLEFYERLADQIGGLHSPFSKPSDLLFDYPALLDYRIEPVDFLIVNSAPMSGQWLSEGLSHVDQLALDLQAGGHRVISTRPIRGLPCTQPGTVTAVGGVSIYAKHIISISTGPSWPTFNAFNAQKCELRIILIDKERIEIAPNTEHCQHVAQARAILTERGVL